MPVATAADELAVPLELPPEAVVDTELAEAAAEEALETALAAEPVTEAVDDDSEEAPATVDEAPAAQVADVGRLVTPLPLHRASAKEIVAVRVSMASSKPKSQENVLSWSAVEQVFDTQQAKSAIRASLEQMHVTLREPHPPKSVETHEPAHEGRPGTLRGC